MAGLSSCCPARTFPTHFILHIFPIIFLPVTLSPNNFATKCGKPHLPPPAGLFSPSKNAPYFSPLPKHLSAKRHPAFAPACGAFPLNRAALFARSPAASSTTHTAPTNGKFYFPIPPNTPHHLPTFSRRALLPLPLPAGATAAPSLSNF